VLDTDVMFATDISELWELFRLFTAKQVGANLPHCISYWVVFEVVLTV